MQEYTFCKSLYLLASNQVIKTAHENKNWDFIRKAKGLIKGSYCGIRRIRMIRKRMHYSFLWHQTPHFLKQASGIRDDAHAHSVIK